MRFPSQKVLQIVPWPEYVIHSMRNLLLERGRIIFAGKLRPGLLNLVFLPVVKGLIYGLTISPLRGVVSVFLV